MSNSINTNNNNNDSENEHLLENKWCLWYRPPSKNTSQAAHWETSQQLQFTADTVENFWRGFRNHPRISKPGHPLNCDYSLFKEGIKPMWEDDFNAHGGRWTYSIERRSATNMSLPALIERSWLDVMLCLIGEGFDPYGSLIGGGVCGIRTPKGPKQGEIMTAKLHIWTKDAGNTEANMKIGERLKEVLNAPDGQLVYTPHDASSGGGAARRNYSLKI